MILEELGRCLAPEPVLPACCSAARRIARRLGRSGPSAEAAGQRREPAAERGAPRPATIPIMSRPGTATGVSITGEKLHVLDGYGADRLVVSARTSGKPRDPYGISSRCSRRGRPVWRRPPAPARQPQRATWTRRGAPVSAVLGTVDQGGALLAGVIDRATIGLCAEMLGSMTKALEMTLDYLKSGCSSASRSVHSRRSSTGPRRCTSRPSWRAPP